jgi:hypothetical protein
MFAFVARICSPSSHSRNPRSKKKGFKPCCVATPLSWEGQEHAVLEIICDSHVHKWRRPSWSLAGVVAIISLGLTLLVAGETKFNMVGFVLVMLASMLSGLRWTITQVLLQGSDHHGEDQVVVEHDSFGMARREM